jgi:hypothetical protein
MVRDGEAAWASLQESVKGWLGQAGGKKMIWPKAKGTYRKVLPITKPFAKVYLNSSQHFNLE